MQEKEKKLYNYTKAVISLIIKLFDGRDNQDLEYEKNLEYLKIFLEDEQDIYKEFSNKELNILYEKYKSNRESYEEYLVPKTKEELIIRRIEINLESRLYIINNLIQYDKEHPRVDPRLRNTYINGLTAEYIYKNRILEATYNETMEDGNMDFYHYFITILSTDMLLKAIDSKFQKIELTSLNPIVKTFNVSDSMVNNLQANYSSSIIGDILVGIMDEIDESRLHQISYLIRGLCSNMSYMNIEIQQEFFFDKCKQNTYYKFQKEILGHALLCGFIDAEERENIKEKAKEKKKGSFTRIDIHGNIIK